MLPVAQRQMAERRMVLQMVMGAFPRMRLKMMSLV
jgi:hypothetical protein